MKLKRVRHILSSSSASEYEDEEKKKKTEAESTESEWGDAFDCESVTAASAPFFNQLT